MRDDLKKPHIANEAFTCPHCGKEVAISAEALKEIEREIDGHDYRFDSSASLAAKVAIVLSKSLISLATLRRKTPPQPRPKRERNKKNKRSKTAPAGRTLSGG